VKGYASAEVFSKSEQLLLREASKIVGKLPLRDRQGRWSRCHEVARFVGSVLGLEICDGYYGMVEHTWLWTTPVPVARRKGHPWFGPPPNILDPYAVGRMPLVQLIHSSSSLPLEYRRGSPRRDVRKDVLEAFFQAHKRRLQ
jgi:hypothetical protein